MVAKAKARANTMLESRDCTKVIGAILEVYGVAAREGSRSRTCGLRGVPFSRCTGLRLESGAIPEVHGVAARQTSHFRGVRGCGSTREPILSCPGAAARDWSYFRGVRGCGSRVEPF